MELLPRGTQQRSVPITKIDSMAANMKKRSELFARDLCLCLLFDKEMNNKPQARGQQTFQWNLMLFQAPERELLDLKRW